MATLQNCFQVCINGLCCKRSLKRTFSKYIVKYLHQEHTGQKLSISIFIYDTKREVDWLIKNNNINNNNNPSVWPLKHHSWLCDVSSPDSGSRYSAEVTNLTVTKNQVKTKVAGAIVQGLSLWFLLPNQSTTLFGFFYRGNIQEGSLSLQDIMPLSYPNPQNRALMNWEPPSGIKTPVWMMSPPTMRFRTWIGRTKMSPRRHVRYRLLWWCRLSKHLTTVSYYRKQQEVW